MVGEIYLAEIFFTNLEGSKIRPILIIKELDEDIISLALTSQFRENRIKVSNTDLIDGFLKKDSLVVIPKNFTIHRNLLKKYLGKINFQKMEEIKKTFCKEMECSN